MINNIKINGKFSGYYTHQETAQLLIELGGIDSTEKLADGTNRMYVKGAVVDSKLENKTKGVGYGDICIMCGMAELVDSGGCATCPNCNAQLKCGL